MIGSRVKAKIVKNKVAPPFRTAEFDLMFTSDEYGISGPGCLLDLGTEPAAQGVDPVIRKMGTFYNFGDTRLGQGRERSKAFLREHPDLAGEIEALIREQRGVPAAIDLTVAANDETTPIEKPAPRKRGRQSRSA